MSAISVINDLSPKSAGSLVMIDIEESRIINKYKFSAGLPAFRSGADDKNQYFYNEENVGGGPDFLSPSEWGDLNEIFGE